MNLWNQNILDQWPCSGCQWFLQKCIYIYLIQLDTLEMKPFKILILKKETNKQNQDKVHTEKLVM